MKQLIVFISMSFVLSSFLVTKKVDIQKENINIKVVNQKENINTKVDIVKPYALDKFSRNVSSRGPIKCPKIKLISYKGSHIRYHKPVTINHAFKEKLIAFEKLVKEVSIEIYGRSPHKIRHLGTYNCRRIGGNRNMLSEHAFGNGIDVASFSFPRLRRGEKLPEGIPKSIKRSFNVDMLKHWNDKRTAKGLHQRFLHTLGHRLINSEIFRVMLGPSFPGHKNHFHLDNAPYDVVSIF